MKKTILSFAVLLALILTFCACGKSETPDTDTTEKVTEFKEPEDYDAILRLTAGEDFDIYLNRIATVAAVDGRREIVESVNCENQPTESVVCDIIESVYSSSPEKEIKKISLVLSVKESSTRNYDGILESTKNCIVVLPEVEKSGIDVSVKTKTIVETTQAATTDSNVCPDCGGSGKWICKTCDNTGLLPCKKCNEKGYFDEKCTLCGGKKTCISCDGSGKKGEDFCPSCDGDGKCKRCLGEGKEPCLKCNNPESAFYERRNGKILCTACEGHTGEPCQTCMGIGVVR